MIEFIQKFWVETILSGFVLFIGTATKVSLNRVKKEVEEQQEIKAGVVALLHDRLYQGCNYYLEKNSISVQSLNNLEHMYNAYKNLGGNGTGTEIFNRCKALPLNSKEND